MAQQLCESYMSLHSAQSPCFSSFPVPKLFLIFLTLGLDQIIGNLGIHKDNDNTTVLDNNRLLRASLQL